mmetsp:Transcript_119932/g.339971  ORF Transcript_119932/g.339971 Transcript_119932/m.339971 type:complete len:195 (+) Transcript_119932:76-660(+)
MSMRVSDTSASGRQKVLVIGPCEAGKSIISNVLAEVTETVSESYRPTVGVRVLEIDVEVRSQRVSVELWDVSGDTKYQKCWPAIKKDATGVVLVYNPEKHQEQELEQWLQWFPRSLNMSPNQVMVIQSTRRQDVPRRAAPLSAKLANQGVGPPAVVSADDMLNARKVFGPFLETVKQSVLDKQRQEEEDVMKGG